MISGDNNNKTIKAPDGHKWQILHSIKIDLISLNAFFASTIRNLQSSMYKLASQIAWTPCTAPSIPAFNPEQS